MNKSLVHIITLSFFLLFGIQGYINVNILHEKNLLNLNSVTTVSPAVNDNLKLYGFKEILELSEENKNIKISKIGMNSEEKTKVNVEIEYNGAEDSLKDLLEKVSSRENLCSINNISLIPFDEFRVKAIVNMDFIKNK